MPVCHVGPYRYALAFCLAGALLMTFGTVARATTAPTLSTNIVEHITDRILHQYSGASRENISVDINLPTVVQQLAPCEAPLAIDGSRDNWLGTVRMTLTCGDSPGWVYNARATVGLTMPVATLRRSLQRNHVLRESDIEFRDANIADLRQGFFLEADALIGAALVRNLTTGQVLTHRTIEVPTMIQRGDKVTIIARGAGLQVAMSGTALADGVHGRQISVRNDSSDQVVRAWVVDRGVVEVPFVSSGGVRRSENP